jgi:sugar lactone lactonase YvrE
VLGALETKRRGEPVVVIGVHSAKFDAEQEPERVAEAMARHGVRHPVIVDERHRIWQAYAVRSWPTLVVIRPDGTVAAAAPGEAELDALDAFVGRVLDEARADGTLARAPLALETLPAPSSGALSFPGKVIALPAGGLAVADSGHHRVLLLDDEGRLRTTIGGGEPGLVDGPLERARFRDPHGLASDGERLYVADTGNHVIRAVDLRRGVVGTIAGTGRLGRGPARGTAPARDVDLRSPWDVALAGDYLLIAMAGMHQLWALDLDDETLVVLAGGGREALDDGVFAEATFAQPSGLALHDNRLYVADSETSAVRYLDLSSGRVHTLVGTGLFDFGDVDGAPETARLQHPIGISHGPAGLLVADTYNHKIKRVDEQHGAVSTWFAEADGVSLREPAGLCQLADGRVVVADTNHHRLVLVTREGRGARELTLEGVRPPEAPASQVEAGGAAVLTLPRVETPPGDVTLRVRLETPPGFDLSEGSRVGLRLVAGEGLEAPPGDLGFEVQGARRGVPVRLRALGEAEEVTLDLHLDVVLCGHGEAAACWPVAQAYRLPVRVSATARPRALDATLALPAPR